MSPTLSHSYCAHPSFAYFKFFTKYFSVAIFFRQISYFFNVIFSKKRIAVIFPDLFLENIERMVFILFESYIFNILKSAVKFVSVFMVSTITNLSFSKKSIGYKSVRRFCDMFFTYYHRISFITVNIFLWFHYSTNPCKESRLAAPQSPEVADFVDTVCKFNRFPYLIFHGVNYT